jgi:hypothetical protein
MRLPALPPGLAMLFWLIVALGCVASVGTAVVDMNRFGQETGSTGLRMVIGLLLGPLAGGLAFGSWKSTRVLRRARNGEGEIAHWRVMPGELDAFRAVDGDLRTRRRNSLKLPRTSPADGLEVIFLDDHVIVDGRVFALMTTGSSRFSSVQIVPGNPLAIQFDMVLTSLVAGSNSYHMTRTGQALRIPIATLARAEGVRVLEHYRKADAREIIVNPDLYGARLRFAYGWLVVSLVAMATGFALNRDGMSPDEVILPLSLAVGGAVCAVGAAVLILICRKLRADQFRR